MKTKDPIGLALSTMNRIAGSPLLDRLHLRKPTEQVAYQGTRAGFRVLSVANREFRRLKQMLPTTRLPGQQAEDLFDLRLSDDQRMIVDALRPFARDVLRPAAADADESGKVPDHVLGDAAELGLTLYAVPEAFGGVAERRSPVTSVLIAEQLAWGDMGLALPLLSGFSAAQAISRWGNGAQQSRYLPPFCEAEPPKATLAIDEARVLFDPQRLNTRAHTSEKGFILSGEKHAVPLAGEADVYLVAAHLEGNGPRLFLVERGCEGLSWKPSPAMGLRAAGLGTLHLDKVKVPSEALLGNNEAFDYAECLAHGALMRCALAVGTAQAVLDYVIPYCNEREAFGEPISHRQSVAFMIANMAIEIDAMRLLVWRAASLCEQGLPFVRETRLAQLLCNEKSMEVGTNGVQLLGGHGFVKEHPVERWYRDLRATAIHTGGLHA